MDNRSIIAAKAPLPETLDDLGGELLEGSGFEKEEPEADFSESERHVPLQP